MIFLLFNFIQKLSISNAIRQLFNKNLNINYDHYIIDFSFLEKFY